MKNRWNKLLTAVFLSLAISGVSAQAQSSGAGNGGDPLELRMENIKTEIRNWIQVTEFKDLNLGGQNANTLAQLVLKSIDQSKFSLTDRRLLIGGKERTCINYPQSQSIECNRTKLNAETDENLYPLMLHEYMGLAGLEQNQGTESDYKYSKQVRDFVEYKLVAKLGVMRRREAELAGMKFIAVPGGAFEIQSAMVTQAQYFTVMQDYLLEESNFVENTKKHCPFDYQEFVVKKEGALRKVGICPNLPVLHYFYMQRQQQPSGERPKYSLPGEIFAARLTEFLHDGYTYRLISTREMDYIGFFPNVVDEVNLQANFDTSSRLSTRDGMQLSEEYQGIGYLGIRLVRALQ